MNNLDKGLNSNPLTKIKKDFIWNFIWNIKIYQNSIFNEIKKNYKLKNLKIIKLRTLIK